MCGGLLFATDSGSVAALVAALGAEGVRSQAVGYISFSSFYDRTAAARADGRQLR